MNNNIAVSLVAALTLLAASATPGIAQVRVPGPLALPLHPTKLAPAELDPLEQPTPRCIVDAATQYAPLDLSQISAKRRLQRSNPVAPGGASPTSIRALLPGSQHWITKCPVQLATQHVVDQGPVCRHIPMIAPNSGTSQLRIAHDGNAFVFKIENSALGKLKGRLTPVRNPHGPNETVWLKSSNVTANGTPNNDYDFYFYLQEGVNGFKFYLVEVFARSDTRCLNEHLPGVNTLCRNPDDGSPCLLRRRAGSAVAAAASRGSQQPLARANDQSANMTEHASHAERSAAVGMAGMGLQTATGGGHEPIER